MAATQQKGDTGQAATFALATSATSVRIKSIKIGAISIDMLDVSALVDTGFHKKIASDLKSAAPWTVTFYYDTLTTIPSALTTPASETCTVTFPMRTSETSACNIAATGNVTSYDFPTLELGAIQMGTLEFTPDGMTGPTLTVAT